MSTDTHITLELPASLYAALQQLAEQDQTDPVTMLTRILAQEHQRRVPPDQANQVIQTLLATDRIRHLAEPPVEDETPDADRQPPPVLPGTPVSELLIAQRRGER